MRRLILILLATLAFASPASAATISVPPGTDASYDAAYGSAQDGDVLELQTGQYGTWTIPAGQQHVTVKAAAGATPTFRQISNTNDCGYGGAGADNITFDGLAVNGNGVRPGIDCSLVEFGAHTNVVFKNGSIGNVAGQKGLTMGGDLTTTSRGQVVDHTRFWNVFPDNDQVHNEAIWASSPGQQISYNTFDPPAGNTGAVTVTRGSWWGQPPYQATTIIGNVFNGPQIADHGSLIFGSFCGDSGSNCSGLVLRGNQFLNGAAPYGDPTGHTYNGSTEGCNTPANAFAGLSGITHETCGTPTPTPTPSPTPTPTPTPSPTPTPTPTPSPSPTPTPPPATGFAGRKPTTSTKSDWTGSGELAGWDFVTTTAGTIDRLCAQTNAASSGVTSVDLALYQGGALKRSARYSGNPGAGQFCVAVSPLAISGTVRLAWDAHGNRLNYQGVAGTYASATGVSGSPPATWPSGSVNAPNGGAFIWAD